MLFKIALSYTTVDNAIENLNTELPHWDFEKYVKIRVIYGMKCLAVLR